MKISLTDEQARRLSRHLYFLALYYDEDNAHPDKAEVLELQQALKLSMSKQGVDYFNEFASVGQMGYVRAPTIPALP